MRKTKPTEQEIEAAFKGTNFGGRALTMEGKRILIAEAIFKRVCDYGDGSTITRIVQELGLVSKKTNRPSKLALRWAYQEIIK